VMGRRLKVGRVPTPADIAARRRDNFKRRVLETVAAGNLEPYQELVRELADQYDAVQLAAAAFKLIAQVTGKSEDRYGAVEEVEPTSSRRVRAGDADMVRLLLHVGRRDGARPGDIVGAIAHEAGVPGKAIGPVAIYDAVSVVAVPQKSAARVLRALKRTSIRGRRLDVKLARPELIADLTR